MALHVVFGAGQIGASLAHRLASQGQQVRVARRSARPIAGPGIEVVSGDATDSAFTLRASQGASVIYHCMNPSAYTGAAWKKEFPAQGEALIAAAIATGARLVCLDNLYAYGVVDGARTETTPLGATGPKGRVRVAWDVRLRAARSDGLRYVVGRAGDFFGPGTADNSLISPSAVAGLAVGRAPWLIGDTAAPHAFSYVPDVVAGLAALGGAPDDAVDGAIFHLPVVTVPPGELITRIATALGSSTRARSLPAWVVPLLGTVVPLFRELRETLYQWDRPFLIDDSAFRTRFPGIASSLSQAVMGTAATVPKAAHSGR